MAATAAPVYQDSNYLGDDPELERIYDNVQAVVPGVVNSMLKLVTWNAIEEFYLKSTWKREVLYWCMPECVTSINFNPFSGDFLVAYILFINGLTRWTIRQPAELIDASCPPESGERKGSVLVALKPTSLDTEFDPELFTTYFQTILDGVLFRLYSQPAKPYTSPQLAQFHGRQNRVGIQRARAEATKLWGPGPGQWVFPYYAAGRRKN